METYFKEAIELDKKDKLSHFKNHFVNDEQVIYFDGNSLGKLPKKTIEVTTDLVQNQWGNRLIRSWNENWMDLSFKLSKKIASLVGAQPDEIFIGDSTSLNLYKLVFAALKANKDKFEVVSDSLNFPTDLYVLQGMIENHFNKHTLKLLNTKDGLTIDNDTLQNTISAKTALITLSYVTYKSSFKYNMKQVNELAHKNNSFIIWDLSHATGAVPVKLNESNADMAVGCTYKYLNGGPGSPAFLYVKKELQQQLLNPIWSWFSHKKPFDFDLNYKASNSIQKFGIGTPSILSLAAIEPGLDILLDAGISNLRAKSVQQSTFLLELIENELLPLGFTIASPIEAELRGSHISIQHAEGYRINRAMIAPKDDSKIIIPDFRPPNNIRLGIAPLYNSFTELCETIERIKNIVLTKEYENFGLEKLEVT
ncbi:MAG: kynureninase [Lutibacter sp.]|uniref:kynureninase n=1 Tax=Lutibacter sp. TaxID=1925666 RepID=UPI001800563C|nr:kynureninase [Lutibacter sp.]MBT8317236.1 kynureninase [Lutibacter sp.]NNJ58095.1 kynureninase [Lutibacter sp.]